MSGKSYYVYLHTRNTDGIVFYVGISCTSRRLKIRHQRNDFWQKTVAKHGYSYHVHVEGLTKEEAIAKEIELIAFYRKESGDKLTNLTDGGEGCVGWKASDETRNRMSIAHTNITDETRLKMSKAHKGRKMPLDAIERIRIWNLNKVVSDETKARIIQNNKASSPEVRLKMSIAAKNRTPEQRKKLSDAAKARCARQKLNGEPLNNAKAQKADFS